MRFDGFTTKKSGTAVGQSAKEIMKQSRDREGHLHRRIHAANEKRSSQPHGNQIL